MHLPFGAIASRVFGVDERAIWRARAVQVVPDLPMVDLQSEPRDASSKEIILKDEAVYYGVLPIRSDGGELVCATTADCLPEAMAYLCSTIRLPVLFVLADAGQLQGEILRVYELGTQTLEGRMGEGNDVSSPRIPGQTEMAETAAEGAAEGEGGLELELELEEDEAPGATPSRSEQPDAAQWPERKVCEDHPPTQPRRRPHPPVGERVPQPRVDSAKPFLQQLTGGEGNAEELMKQPERVRFRCACGQPINVPSTYSGKRVRCGGCKKVLKVPDTETARSAAHPSEASQEAVGADATSTSLADFASPPK